METCLGDGVTVDIQPGWRQWRLVWAMLQRCVNSKDGGCVEVMETCLGDGATVVHSQDGGCGEVIETCMGDFATVV
jgi:hypothetical protein